MLPKAGATFSIGEEQSLSHATSLGWSAPGLAAYRRCMLGILTSNFLLSLWGTTDGADKWARLGIVNNTLRQYFKSSVEGDEYLLEQKGKIQSFAWSSPCNQCVEHPGVSENLGRWGIHILAVANQADDVVLLRVESQKTSSELTLEVLSHYSLTASEQVYPDTVPGSLFERTLQRQGPTIKHMAFKSWNTTPLSWDDESVNLTSAMALIYGTELRLLRFGAFMEFSESTGWSIKSIQIHGAGLEADTAVLISARFTGPITWIYEVVMGHTTHISHNC